MKSFNFRFVYKTLGFLLILESILLLLSAFVGYYYKDSSGHILLTCAGITLSVGLLLRIFGIERANKIVGKRESFLIVTLAWVVLSFFGMLPFYLSGAIPNVAGAFFETMSGFTTTGATVIRDIDILPRGLLFWRAFTQWIGGIGIVVFAIALLPMVGGNGSALFDAESSGISQDRFRPRITQIAKRLWFAYIAVSALMVVLLLLGPMNLFDAVCHAMATLSTGGYSTKNVGVSYWNSPYTEYVVSIFMFIGGLNFALVYFVLRGKPMKLFKDDEFRWYTVIAFGSSFMVGLCLYFTHKIPDFEQAIRYGLFQTMSILTSTGFCVPNYMTWGAFYFLVFCLLMMFCACAGSTAGGMKMVRLVVLGKNAVNQFKLQVHPNAILPVRLNGSVLPFDIVTKILAFIFLYLAILAISFLVLSFAGMGFEEAVGAAMACLGNVGPGLGHSGIVGHFADANAFSKWYLSFLMLLGRLEIFTVLSLFMPSFWKK